MQIPQIEPFQFIRSTAFSERVQLANKINEIIAGINQIGDIPDLENQITELTAKVTELEESIGNTDTSLAELENQVNGLISEVNTTIKQAISGLQSEVDGIDARLKTAEGTISEHGTEIGGLKTRMSTAENGVEANKSDIDTIEAKQTEHETEIQGLLREVVDGVAVSSTAHGTVQVTINHEDGTQDTSAPIDLGLVQEGGITLSTGATDRSFRLTVHLSDGSSWETNDFVIPEGGGTEVVVTSIQIKKGSQDDMMKVSIGLSDGSSIDSNDWSFVTPAQFAALQSTVSTNTGNITSLTGRVTAIDSQLDTIDGSLDSLDDRVTALEGSPGYNLPVATASVLGGVKIGGNIAVQADGTISIPIAGSALGVMKNGGNVVIDSSGRANVNLSGYATKSALNAIDSRVSALEEAGDTVSQYSTFSTVVSNAKLGDIVTVFHLDEDSYGFSFTGVCINASGSGSTKDVMFSGSGMLVEVTNGTQKPLNGLSMTPSVMLPLAFTKAGNAIALMPVKNNTTTTPDNIRLIHFE